LRSIGNAVYRKVPRVRIPPSPPAGTKTITMNGLSSFWLHPGSGTLTKTLTKVRRVSLESKRS